MVLASRIRVVWWGFVAIAASTPFTRWLAVTFESQPSTCPSQILFGVACPACGATRAGLYLLSGDVVSAIQSNMGMVAFTAAMAAVLLQQQRDEVSGFVASMVADRT